MKQLLNFGIKGKILLLLAFAVFSFAGLAYYSVSALFDMSKQVELFSKERIPVTDALGTIDSTSNAIPRFLWLSLAYPPGSEQRAKFLKKSDEVVALMDEHIKEITEYNLKEEDKANIAIIAEEFPKLKEAVELGKKAMSVGTPEADIEAKQILLKNMPPHAVKITEVAFKLNKSSEQTNQDYVQVSQAKSSFAIKLQISLAICIGLILFVMGFYFSHRMSKELLRITQSVEGASQQVTSASHQLSKASESLSDAVQTQVASLIETTASLTEVSSMVDENVKGAEAAHACANEIHQTNSETQKSMESLSVAMNEILESNKQIEALVRIIEEIGAKTEVIDDIVFKTQLLSFNASVEAERAGEHGRGFSVVAQEVGNLAQHSGRAATEITNIVKTSVKEASAIAQSNKERVESGGELAVETRKKIEKMIQQVSNILESTQNIVINSQGQSAAISQISSSVDTINKNTHDSAAIAEETASASTELSGQADSLLNLVSELHHVITGEGSAEAAPANATVDSSSSGEFSDSAKKAA